MKQHGDKPTKQNPYCSYELTMGTSTRPRLCVSVCVHIFVCIHPSACGSHKNRQIFFYSQFRAGVWCALERPDDCVDTMSESACLCVHARVCVCGYTVRSLSKTVPVIKLLACIPTQPTVNGLMYTELQMYY